MDIYGFFFSPWFWFALTVLFIVLELASAINLVTIWFAISSLLMIFISGLTKSLETSLRLRVDVGIFIGIAVILFIFTRPIAVKKLKIGKQKTNIDSLVNREAMVTKKISKFERGEIKLDGKIWTAITKDGEDCNEGETCVVTGFEGVKAVVKKALP